MAAMTIHYDDSIESIESEPDFTITPEEAEQLHAYLEKEYISFEFFPKVIDVVRRLRVYVEE